jgi:hypothetical protein
VTTIMAVAADGPFMGGAAEPLASNNTAFLTEITHQARCIVAVRRLKSVPAGAASGIVNVQRGAHATDEDVEREALFYVNRDGSARSTDRIG